MSKEKIRLTEQESLAVIRTLESGLSWTFPNEHLGVADRCLWNKIAIESAIFFKQHNPEGRLFMHYNLIMIIYQEAKKYGFDPKEKGETR